MYIINSKIDCLLKCSFTRILNFDYNFCITQGLKYPEHA